MGRHFRPMDSIQKKLIDIQIETQKITNVLIIRKVPIFHNICGL